MKATQRFILKPFCIKLTLPPGSTWCALRNILIVGNAKEAQANNQRFRIYRQVMENLFSTITFAHFSNEANSAYLMVNKSNNIGEYVSEMQNVFIHLYPDMFNLHFSEIY